MQKVKIRVYRSAHAEKEREVKVSELLKSLETLKETYGDFDVVCHGDQEIILDGNPYADLAYAFIGEGHDKLMFLDVYAHAEYDDNEG